MNIELSKIDFNDYLNHYVDLKKEFGNNVEKAKQHWINHGKYEGRLVKINFDYNKIEKFITNITLKSNSYFSNILINKNEKCLGIKDIFLVTTLYNETNIVRKKELMLALNHNINNKMITKIILFYDTSKGKDISTLLYLSSIDKILIQFTKERPFFKKMMEFSNNFSLNYCKNNIISQRKALFIISNTDIIFDETLAKIYSINMSNKILALTRWDFVAENKIGIRVANNKIMTTSQDTWIFESPLDLRSLNPEFDQIQLGTWECDGAINYFVKNSNINIFNPCLDIKTLHIHFSNVRNYIDKEIKYNSETKAISVSQIK